MLNGLLFHYMKVSKENVDGGMLMAMNEENFHSPNTYTVLTDSGATAELVREVCGTDVVVQTTRTARTQMWRVYPLITIAAITKNARNANLKCSRNAFRRIWQDAGMGREGDACTVSLITEYGNGERVGRPRGGSGVPRRSSPRPEWKTRILFDGFPVGYAVSLSCLKTLARSLPCQLKTLIF